AGAPEAFQWSSPCSGRSMAVKRLKRKRKDPSGLVTTTLPLPGVSHPATQRRTKKLNPKRKRKDPSGLATTTLPLPGVSHPATQRRTRKLNPKRKRKDPSGLVTTTLPLPGAPLARDAAQRLLAAIDEEGALSECPSSWHRLFKKELGTYRRFLAAHPQLFSIKDLPGDCFVVTRCGADVASEFLADRRCWRRALRSAWRRYCLDTSDPCPRAFTGQLKAMAGLDVEKPQGSEGQLKAMAGLDVEKPQGSEGQLKAMAGLDVEKPQGSEGQLKALASADVANPAKKSAGPDEPAKTRTERRRKTSKSGLGRGVKAKPSADVDKPSGGVVKRKRRPLKEPSVDNISG
ncbi:unnamed protein product, partial [Effrenium voratum]